MKRIFVTATNTDVGKTYATEMLLRHYAALGYRVAALKPIETGVTSTPPDATQLLATSQRLNPALSDLTIEDICPYRFSLPAAPCVAAACTPFFSLDLLETKIAALRKRCDIVLIEGAGGVMVPIHRNYFMRDLMIDLKATPLLVTHDRLGCIDDTLTHLDCMRHAGISPQWCVNLRDEAAFQTVTAPFYRNYFGDFLTLQHDLERLAQKLLSS